MYLGTLDICLAIYELDATCFLTVPGLPWQVTLENTKLKLDLLAGNDMLLMVEKCVRGGICHALHWYAKADNQQLKDHD